MSVASGGRHDSSDVDVFLPQSDGETSRYDPLALSGRVSTPATSSSSRVTLRPRIPSVREVGEKSEGPNWTMSSPAQNLAAALNDPANREYDLFTRTWGMYFVPNAPLPPSTIPNIQLGDFIRYLKETSGVSWCQQIPFQYLLVVSFPMQNLHLAKNKRIKFWVPICHVLSCVKSL